MNNYYPEMGTVFIFDIHKWQKYFHRSVVRDLNKYSTKIYLHRGRLWERQKRMINKKLYTNSILCKLQVEHPKGHKDAELQVRFANFLIEIRNTDSKEKES